MAAAPRLPGVLPFPADFEEFNEQGFSPMYGEQDGDCAGCGEHFTSQRHLEVDHIVPKKHGGTHHKTNLQLLCGHCNRVKAAGSMSKLMVKLMERRQNGY